MAFSVVRINVAFHQSLEVVERARNSGFMAVWPSCMVEVKVKDLVFPERVMMNFWQCQQSGKGYYC